MAEGVVTAGSETVAPAAAGRLAEVDALRGLAVGLMVVYHLGFGLDLFGLVHLPVQGGCYDYLGNAIASLFLLVVGISLSISYHRGRRRHGRHDPSAGDVPPGPEMLHRQWPVVPTSLPGQSLHPGDGD
ncbi:heparan-alpha-glucosaminide N-acetyltransferase domain-containing protein [Thiohalorhabdus sp.]|uniref:heparan-alpha-glucosaminide N-acetyltransferase domain-containing protein n=1 Tax=Thiohalorhabdus sp. TaxID=3094134 RepID=UPI002FC33184